ncbi:unnamed protein product [Caenorhabditis angaria]|uniref:Uncharacterized protein n=1 Tax=Caenorhabditis angaria TaxID=860376 RepID=A0A9P1IJ98_9PELO|nr:unnamed protein product [Caenorhabditis angaria]
MYMSSSATMGFPSTPLEAKQALGISASSLNASVARSGSPMLTNYQTQQFSFAKCIEQWKSKEICRWIEGLGDQMNPYLGMIRDNIKSGKQLECLDDDSLKKIGISALGARKTILQSISLLMYLCYEAENENLQRLAHKVRLSCVYLEKTMSSAIRQREKANRRAEIVNILNSVSNAVLQVSDNTKKLVFWLDRTPFDEITTYIETRNIISSLMWNLLRNVNVQPKALFETGQQIIKLAKELGDECQKIVESDDSLILYSSFVEVAMMKRASSSVSWGLNIQSSFRGVHVISEIKEGSPADACTKIDAGDEILMINGKTVVGWDLMSVAQKIGANDSGEMSLIIKRRPREPQLPKQSKLAARALAPASQTTKTYSTDEYADPFENSDMIPIKRHRSHHALSETVKENEKMLKRGRRTLRRGSVASATPSKEIKNLEETQGDLREEIDGEEEALVPRIAKRARTMRHQPDGYVRSFIDNKLVCDIEDDVVNDQLTFNVKCPTEFAQIKEITQEELRSLNICEPRITDDEWRAPYQEFASQSYRAIGDSNISAYSILDSPRFVSGRMTSSSIDETGNAMGVLPSPSTSSMNSVSSPAPFGFAAARNNMSLSMTEWPCASSDDLPGSPGVANYMGMEKLFEGWVKRRKTRAELSANEVTNKWPKCWMCLKGHYLLLFSNQYSKRPDMVINLVKATISDSTDLKTSKKNIFRITCPPLDYHFSCLTSIDWKNWIQKMKAAKDIYSSSGMSSTLPGQRHMSTSVSTYNHHSEDIGGVPMSTSQHDDLRSPKSSSTLPRTFANGISPSKSGTIPSSKKL